MRHASFKSSQEVVMRGDEVDPGDMFTTLNLPYVETPTVSYLKVLCQERASGLLLVYENVIP